MEAANADSVECGVPQGRRLGPLLFFTNDLPLIMNNACGCTRMIQQYTRWLQ
jgi:hypothetical protein